jgi:glycine dehydrogenase subunit 2
MVEPTETEPIEVLNDFIEVVKKTCEMAYTNPQEVLKAPVNTVVGKIDEAKAAHPKTICLSWRRLCQLIAE